MKKELIPAEQIAQSIHFLRGQKVMLRLRRALPCAFPEQGVALLSSVCAWVAHASRVLVGKPGLALPRCVTAASRRNELPSEFFWPLNSERSPQWRDAIASARDARATQ